MAPDVSVGYTIHPMDPSVSPSILIPLPKLPISHDTIDTQSVQDIITTWISSTIGHEAIHSIQSPHSVRFLTAITRLLPLIGGIIGIIITNMTSKRYKISHRVALSLLGFIVGSILINEAQYQFGLSYQRNPLLGAKKIEQPAYDKADEIFATLSTNLGLNPFKIVTES